MKRYILTVAVCAIVVLGAGYLLLPGNDGKTPVNGLLGFNSENVSSYPSGIKEFDQVGLTASRSQQGVIKASQGEVYGFEITSDANGLRYFELFDMTKAEVPSRGASLSALRTYKASTSWASTANLNARPVGSNAQYASPSLVFSIPIPGATSSASPTIVRITEMPALSFSKGIIFAISSVYGTYSSASVNTARHTVKVLYK